MVSYLSRLVFRRLIANQSIVHRGCCYHSLRKGLAPRHGFQSRPQAQLRTFFNIFKKEKKLKPVQIPAGLEKLSELAYAQNNSFNPPTPNDVADAFKDFFCRRRGPFEDFHMALADRAFRYLLENRREDGVPWFGQKFLDKSVLGVMMHPSRRPDNIGKAHISLGRAILDELVPVPEIQEEAEADARSFADTGTLVRKVVVDVYPLTKMDIMMRRVELLSVFGAASEAMEIVETLFQSDTTLTQLESPTHPWHVVVQGLVREDNMKAMLRATDMIQTLSIPLSRAIQEELVAFFCRHKDLEKAKFWYVQPLISVPDQQDVRPSGKASSAILKASAFSKDQSYGYDLVTTLLKDNTQDKQTWDAIFVWSAAVGKGVDEVDRMMSVMIRQNDEARQSDPSVEIIRPDIETMNTLVELSMSRQDPYSAERYVTLGEKRGILPNEKSHLLQIQYRISVGDLDGAKAAYFNLLGSSSGSKESETVINQLIQALCKSKQTHFDEMMIMVDHLHERKATFAPETVAALVLIHLQRAEIHDAKDLLQMHAHQYSPDQRVVIRQALTTFILDGKTSTADAWAAYQIIHHVFSESPRDDRIAIMNEFFKRKRGDMGCHVFFHMRNHVSKAYAANRAVYVAAFTGFARCQDAESLEYVHNQLRLDFTVEIDSQLRNALMLAYAATGDNNKALKIWNEICASDAGPTYNSFAIAFRACEGTHWGGEHAKGIWARLDEYDIATDKQIWIAYLCAIARNHHHDEALSLIEAAEEKYGFTPDLEIICNWFNCTANNNKQSHVEAWIKQHHPEIWSQMEALGHHITYDGFGYRQFHIERHLEP